MQNKFSLLILALFMSQPALSYAPGEFFTSGSSDQKKLALSFDDGPGRSTPEFLELLKKTNVKATFFVLGNEAGRRKEVLKQTRDQGHEIANHTWNHVNYKWRARELKKEFGEEEGLLKVKAELKEDIEKTHTTIEQVLGEKMDLLRMPHGIDRPWIKEVAKETGFTLVNWTHGSDWLKSSAEELSKSYIKAIRPGAILLFHDGGGKRSKSLTIAENVIRHAQENGYEIVTVGELLKQRGTSEEK